MANLYNSNLQDVIKPVEPPLMRNEVAFMFSRKSPCATHIANINLLIQNLSDDGTLELWTMRHLGGTLPKDAPGNDASGS